MYSLASRYRNILAVPVACHSWDYIPVTRSAIKSHIHFCLGKECGFNYWLTVEPSNLIRGKFIQLKMVKTIAIY